MDIIIREEKIDWLKIVDLVFKRQDWGKTYTLYTSGSTEISCVLKEFNFEESKAWFRISVKYFDKEGIKYTKTALIMYVINHFSIADFKMHLNKKLITLLQSSIDYQTEESAIKKFLDLKHYAWTIKEKDIIEAGFKGILKAIDQLDDEDLHDDCLEVLKDKTKEKLNEPFDQKVEAYMKTHKFKNESMELLLGRLEEQE